MPETVSHNGHRQRMRERLRKNGLTAFKDHEILEMLLFSVYSRANTNGIAHSLLEKFGDLAGVFSADQCELTKVEGVGIKCAEYIRFIGELYAELVFDHCEKKELESENDIVMYACLGMAFCPAGSAVAALVDKNGNVILREWLCSGKEKREDNIDGFVTEMDNFHGACSLVLMHNHRGGPAKPSPDDIAITVELKKKAQSVGITKVWHVIVSDDQYTFI